MQHDPFRPNDTETIRQVLDGDVNAFESLVVRYRVLVTKIVQRHVDRGDVEETAQEAFVRAYRSLPTFKGQSDFRQWLSAIVIRTCHDYWRKAYRSREIPLSALTERHQEWLEEAMAAEPGEPSDQKTLQKEAREVLDWALPRLSAKDRMVLELVYLEELSVKQAANLLGWSAANVKVRAFRSRRKLEKLLREVLGLGRRMA
jgi:RNA polymerase sigma-70 factor (ECF subfamily)